MNDLLPRLLREPDRINDLQPADWDLLIPQARNAKMLATVYGVLRDVDALQAVPEQPRVHLFSEWVLHQRQIESLHYELRWLLRAVRGLEIPLVLLKGGAYLRAQLPAGEGRLIADIDLLVPRERLHDAERAFIAAGWEGGFHDDYDERYYRQWMHEIPPLSHLTRSSTIDVHHAIVPPTASPKTDASKLFEQLVELEDGLFVLGPWDMVVHSAAHLFHEGEFHNGFRDIYDLHRLLSGFSASDPGFWEGLVSRAAELELLRPAYYAMRYARQMFATPVPDAVLRMAEERLGPGWRMPLMDALFLRAFAPDHDSCEDRFSGAAKFALYIRSHFLRMPLYLLVPHLLRKAWRRVPLGDRRSPTRGDDEVQQQ